LARAEADAKGLRLCFALRASVFVRGVCAPQCPLSSVMVCDNDGATFLAVPVSDDGTARVDFSLQPSVRVRHAEPGVTDRLKFHFRARDSPTHEFGVCSGHFYLRELLAQAATGQRVPKAQSDTVRTRMARAAKGRVFVVSDNFQPVEVHFTVSGGSADAVARFDALYEAGAIRDSVLWQSEKMNALVETQVGLLADMLQQHTVVSLERGLSPFLNMGTCHPMEGERLLFPDISKNMEYMRAEFAPAGATAYLIVMAFNCNAVHVEDAYHMNDHNLAHMLACTTAGTFTKDGLAAGYVTDVNVSGAALTYNAMLCAAFAATTATENMPRGLGGPNVGPVVFSSGDCEDHSRTIEAVLKVLSQKMPCCCCNSICRADTSDLQGCIELHERGLGGAGALPFLAQLAPATLEAVLYCAGRFHAMLAPFRARLGPLAAGAKAKAAEPSVLVDVTNVLGTALAPSAGGEIAGGGELAGHSYMHMELRHADGRAENLVLEGTTPLSNVEAAPRERSMPVLHTVPREAAERFVACNGGRVLAATADSVTLELDVPVTALLQAVEAEPFMAVDPKMCRRDVPCFSVSHRSARSHVHELGGSLLPSLVPKKLREAAKKVWDRFAHGKRSKCAHTACEEQEVEETEDEPAENRARSFYQARLLACLPPCLLAGLGALLLACVLTARTAGRRRHGRPPRHRGGRRRGAPRLLLLLVLPRQAGRLAAPHHAARGHAARRLRGRREVQARPPLRDLRAALRARARRADRRGVEAHPVRRREARRRGERLPGLGLLRDRERVRARAARTGRAGAESARARGAGQRLYGHAEPPAPHALPRRHPLRAAHVRAAQAGGAAAARRAPGGAAQGGAREPQGAAAVSCWQPISQLCRRLQATIMMPLAAARVIAAARGPAVLALLAVLRAALPPDTDVDTAPAVLDANMDVAALFPRLLAAAGARLDGKQIFDERVLGAYLAHAQVWAQVPPGATWLVLEDDALLPDAAQLARALPTLLETPYDYVNLAPTWPPLGSQPSLWHPGLRECPRNDIGCAVLGSFAYLVTHAGAQKLLAHARPPEVAVDWYVSSLRDFLDPSFALAFVTEPLFATGGRPSTIGHHCLLCRLPRDELTLACVATLCAAALFAGGFVLRDTMGPIAAAREAEEAARLLPTVNEDKAV